MNIKRIKRISDFIYVSTILYALAIIVKNYYESKQVTEGVNVINNNMSLIIVAIVLLVITFITTSIIDYKYGKHKKMIAQNSFAESINYIDKGED